MIVYVITEGDYSDYHIIGVATDIKTAEAFRKKQTSYEWNEVRIEAYDTDDIRCYADDMSFWLVRRYRNGNVLVQGADSAVGYSMDEKNIVHRWGNEHIVYVLAKDAEHAKKIGIDLIMQSRYRKEIEEGGLNGESDIS